MPQSSASPENAKKLKTWKQHVILVSYVLSLAFVFNYSVLSCQGAWLHPLYSSVEVALYPDLTHNKYLGLRLGEKVLYVGSSHPLRSCIRLYNTCSNTLIYLWSLILLCGDVETNPGPTNGSDVDIDVHSKFCKRSLVLNCGFARVAIYDLSNMSKGHHRDNIDEAARRNHFQKLFKHCNVLPSLMLSPLKSASATYFDVYCDHILDAIHEHRWSGKQKYFDTFTMKKWEKMSVADRKKHTVSKCYACSMQYTELQRSFPLKPFFEVSIVNPQLCSSKNTKFEAKVVLKELNGVFEVKHIKSFTDILPKVCNLKAITQPQRKENRKCPSKTALIRDCEKRMSENVAITHLAECESDASYVRKRKMTSFTAVSSEPKKGHLCQIPSDEESEIVSFLQNYCEDKPIVWSAVAKQFNITTTNGGHMVEQLAIRSGLNVESLQCKKDNVLPRNRVHKNKTSDSKVPVPCMPSLAKLKQEVSNLIDNGTLYLGEPCAPYSIYRYKWVDGNLDTVELVLIASFNNCDCLLPPDIANQIIAPSPL